MVGHTVRRARSAADMTLSLSVSLTNTSFSVAHDTWDKLVSKHDRMHLDQAQGTYAEMKLKSHTRYAKRTAP
jgi:hypothetical protein